MYAVDEDLCTGCGLCVEECPSGAIKALGRAVEISEGLCTACGSCAEVCPQDAIYEYEELPVLQGQKREAVRAGAPHSPLTAAERSAPLARQQKIAAAAVLLPVLSKLLFRLAGRVSLRGGNRSAKLRQPSCSDARGGHRWHGGR
ncbi:MAG: 4Fe-4S binding protein [Actinomycetota bacterium]